MKISREVTPRLLFMKRTLIAVSILLLVLIVHDTFLVIAMKGSSRHKGTRKVEVSLQGNKLWNLTDQSWLDVPNVMKLPTNEVVLTAIANGVRVSDDGAIFVKLKIDGYPRPLFSLSSKKQWLDLTELVGVVAPRSLNLNDATRNEHADVVAFLERQAEIRSTLRNDDSWNYGGVRSLEIVRQLLYDDQRICQTNVQSISNRPTTSSSQLKRK
jgi:hypothetical protein